MGEIPYKQKFKKIEAGIPSNIAPCFAENSFGFHRAYGREFAGV
jgi:hypothetical protein